MNTASLSDHIGFLHKLQLKGSVSRDREVRDRKGLGQTDRQSERETLIS